MSNDCAKKVKNELGERAVSTLLENREGGSGMAQLKNVNVAVVANGIIAIEEGLLNKVLKVLVPGGKLSVVVVGGDLSRVVVSKMVLAGFLNCTYDINQTLATGWSRQ